MDDQRDEPTAPPDDEPTAPPDDAASPLVGREKDPAEVALLVGAALSAAALAGFGIFAWMTRLHSPFHAAWLLALSALVAGAGTAVWAEATRRGARPPRLVLGGTLGASAVAVPLALTSSLSSTGAPSRVSMALAGLLVIATLPIVTGLAVDRTRPVARPWLPAAAVGGGALLGGLLASTVAVLEAPEFPDGQMHGPAETAWERLHEADTVAFQSLRQTRGGDEPPSRGSVRGGLDLQTHQARYTQAAGTPEAREEEVEWDPAEPWAAAGPVERLWRSLVGVGEWESSAGGWQGRVDPRRITAARIEAMDGLRSRLGARWHMGEGTDGSSMTVLLRVDDEGFPTRLVTRERAPGSEVEAMTTTTFRR